MKPASAGLISLLTPGPGALQLESADCYTFTLASGAVSRFTSADIDLVFNDGTFLSTNALFKRGKISSQLGLQVPNLDIVVAPRPTDLIGGITWFKAAAQGQLDGASVLVEKFISNVWTNTRTIGRLFMYLGNVAGISADRSKLSISLKPPTTLLNRKVPYEVYQTTCVHTLYDSGCSLLKATFTVAGAVAAGTLTPNAFTTNLAAADGRYNLGVITFTSGLNNGLQRTVDAYVNAGGLVTIPLALPNAPIAGDTFTIYPGCNKVYSGDCLGKFANQANFKGFPFIPQPETAY